MSNNALFCGMSSKIPEILYLSLAFVLFSYYTIRVIWLRNYYPIKEMSVGLLILTILSGFMNFSTYLLSSLIMSSDYIQSDTIIRVWSSLAFISRVCTAFPYFLRTLRLYVVFEPKITSRVTIYIFSREYILMTVFFIVFGLLFFFAYVTPAGICNNGILMDYLTENLPFIKDNCESNLMILFATWIWKIIHTAELIFLLLALHLIRNIPRDYNFKMELVRIFVLFFFIDNISILAFPLPESLLCIGPIPVELFTDNLKPLGVLYFSVIRPLNKATINHFHMPPKMILGNLEGILQDTRYFPVFYEFIQQYTQNSYRLSSTLECFNINHIYLFVLVINTNPMSILAKDYLDFLISYRVLTKNTDDVCPGGLDDLIRKYILDKDPPIFPTKIIKSFSKMNMNMTQKLIAMSEPLQQAYNYIDWVYLNDYPRTKSSETLKALLGKYEIIYYRLALFRMINNQLRRRLQFVMDFLNSKFTDFACDLMLIQ